MLAERPSPRVVVAAPLFNKAQHLEEAARSLLAQTERDLVLLLIDDGSTDGTLELCRALAAEDPRVEVHVNPERLGMLGNTRRGFALARERYPQAEFWALGSDHDVWSPTWLERLVALLDEHPDAVLAYPQTQRIDELGRPYDAARAPWRAETRGIRDPFARMRAAFRGMVAGDMIYGLFRARVLDSLGGVYRDVLVPDRLLLSEVALQGEFVQAPEVLWRRRFRGLADLDRQRRAFFLGAAPRHAAWPWWLQHTGALLRAYVVRRSGVPGLGRVRGLRVALTYLRLALALRYRRRMARPRRTVRRHVRVARGRVNKLRHHYAPYRVRHRVEGRLVLRFGLPAATRLRRGAAVLPAGGSGMIALAERLEAAVVLQSVAAAARAARQELS